MERGIRNNNWTLGAKVGGSKKWILRQKDEAQQEGSRISNFYHVTRQREVHFSEQGNLGLPFLS